VGLSSLLYVYVCMCLLLLRVAIIKIGREMSRCVRWRERSDASGARTKKGRKEKKEASEDYLDNSL